MAADTLPDGAYQAADEAFEAYRVGDEGPRDELEAALLAAAPLIRDHERERIRAMAERTKAVCTDSDEGSQCWFADLLAEPATEES